MTYSLDGNGLGDIQTLKHGKRARLQIMPIPLADSDDTESFDVGGVVRTVKISGSYGETSPAIGTWAATMLALVDGDQKKSAGDYGYDYVDDFLGVTINVKVEFFNFEFVKGNPNEIEYVLEMVETTNTS